MENRIYYGVSDSEEKELHSIDEVAHFICDEGYLGKSVEVYDQDGFFVLDTSGPYINQCLDKEFLAELKEVLIPLQLDIEQQIFNEALMSSDTGQTMS